MVDSVSTSESEIVDLSSPNPTPAADTSDAVTDEQK